MFVPVTETCCDMKRLLHKSLFGDILLFCGLGFFALFIFAHFADLSDGLHGGMENPKLLTAAVLIHIGMGTTVLVVERRISRSCGHCLMERWRLLRFIVWTAVIVLMLNYLLFVVVKWIVDVPHPFRIQWQGGKALLVIWLVEIVVISQLLLTNFYRNLVRLYRRNEELERNETKNRYRVLQNQLSPHFLFNSLNTLVSEIQYDAESAVRFTSKLSDVYRYILECQDCRTVSLNDELSFAESYIYLHNVRLGDSIRCECRIGEQEREASLPPLTLQLLCENIIKHNVIDPRRNMVISIFTERDGTRLCVSNPIRQTRDVVSSGKGLRNLDQRYLLLTGHHIEICKDDDRFTVKVPLIHE